jgi:hypothetical protein
MSVISTLLMRESGESISRPFVRRHLADIGGPDLPAENRLLRRLRSQPRLLVRLIDDKSLGYGRLSQISSL